ncbi:hypothetical protein VNO78_25322 [Psophocarpus tetragonolobus]|uniref:C2 domain-containing protein n=1 Tax=Psophocarpus tetragonolobus TaxID=3891 RepID=A0AAN9S996_PSOTE
MGLSSHTLEITVISGENVRVTEDAYVVVRAESLNCCTTRTVAKENGSNLLSWNEKFLLDMPMHARSITFEVQCSRFKASRPLGVARIAASDFLPSAVPDNRLQVLSYGLRDWEGKRNGVIHFAVRVAPPSEEPLNFKSAVKPVVPRKGCGDRNEVVVGIPICWNYPNII